MASKIIVDQVANDTSVDIIVANSNVLSITANRGEKLEQLADLTPTNGNVIQGNGTDWISSPLTLGTMSEQDSDDVSITGGSITGITDLAIADGGTGASTAAQALDNLGIDGSSGAIVLGDLAAALQALLVPTGTILDFGGTSAPTGYLACDGSAVSRTTYAALFTAIGTTWGSGDGSTTFNVPNLSRKTTVGSGGTGTSTLANSVGSTGGEETHLLTGAESGTSVHGHSSSASINRQTGVGASHALAGTAVAEDSSFITDGGIVNVSVSNSSAASAASAHNNMQPSAVVLKIIKT